MEDMKAIHILMTCPPHYPYLIQQLQNRFTLLQLPNTSENSHFIGSIRAVVGSSVAGASASLIDQLPNLEIVASYSVGLDKIDLERCKKRGIRVTNTPDVLTDDVADLAIGLILAVLRRLCACDAYVRSGQWKKGEYMLSSKFSGKSIGVLGLGRIGMAIAKRAEAFNCPIGYHARTMKPAPPSYTYYPTVKELALSCDVLIVACSLTADTHHIISRDVLNALGPKGVLINIARGSHVDEVELVLALKEGRLGGAGLDVFEDEPHVPKELLDLENVVTVPHIGSATCETRKAMADLVVSNLVAHFSNHPLLTPVL